MTRAPATLLPAPTDGERPQPCHTRQRGRPARLPVASASGGDRMHLLDRDGVPLDAELTLADVSPGVYELVLESAGGRSRRGSPPRNSQYPVALETALRRLADVRAVLTD